MVLSLNSVPSALLNDMRSPCLSKTPNRPALFEPSCWNQYDVCLAQLFSDPRKMYQPHHLRWSFLTALKLEQGLTEQNMTDRLMRRPSPQRAAKWIRIDEMLGTMVYTKF